MNMTKRTYWGLFGGSLIMLEVFLTGNGLNFDSKALNTTGNLLLFIAGLGVVAFARLGRRTLVAYSAIAATTLGLVIVIDMLRAGTLDLTVKLVALVVGIVLALMASIGGDLMTYIAPTRDVPVAKAKKPAVGATSKK
jgi:drug/metabolite transporter (DMT)-like permease